MAEKDRWIVYECPHCSSEVTASPNLKVVCPHVFKKDKVSFEMFPVGFREPKVPKRLWRLVRLENYGELLIRELDKRIVGEEKSKAIIKITAFGGRLVQNSKTTSYNLLFSDCSGVGKDYFVKNSLELLPHHYWNHKTRLSERALSYWHPFEKEPNFSWDGKILYCEDSTHNFLNCDTTKVMMTGGSDIAIVDKGELKSLRINGSPIFLVTSATAEPTKELVRRISSTSLDSSEAQTQRIKDFQVKAVIEGLQKYDDDLINSAYLLKRVFVEIPFAKELISSFPSNIQARTNFDRLLDLIKANAGLHQYSREWKGADRVIATREDLEIGLKIFEWLYPSRNASLTHAQQKLANYLKDVKISKTAAEIFREVGTHHYNSMKTMIGGLRALAHKGFIDISGGERDGRSRDLYSYIPELTQLTQLTQHTQHTPLTHPAKKEDKRLDFNPEEAFI